ncbi:MAG TPA: hypothetical protein VGK73_11410 [Polyangiaceae bacterium]
MTDQPSNLPGVDADSVAVLFPDDDEPLVLLRSGGTLVPGGSAASADLARKLPELSEIVRGNAHTCALTRTGSILCWGENEFGQLGIGRFGAASAPAVVVADRKRLAGKPAPTALSTAAAAVRNESPRLAMGEYHVCGVTTDGRVRCSGSADYRELGVGALDPARTKTPSVVVADMWGVHDAVEVAAGSSTTCVRRANGLIACTGDQGLQTPEAPGPSRRLRPVSGIAGSVSLAVGTTVACAALASGKVMCWGDNRDGELGLGLPLGSASTPLESHQQVHEVAGLSDAVEVAAASESMCARRKSGGIVCWGRADRGQLGDGSVDARPRPAPVPGIRNATALSAQRSSVCAIHDGGRVSCWGWVGGYHPEDPEIAETRHPPGHNGLPRRVQGLPRAKNLGVGAHTGCIVTEDGRAFCFEPGESRAPSFTVVEIQAPGGGAYVQMVCGLKACCGLERSGIVSCHGDVASVVPGFDPNQRATSPVVVPGLELR